ncbi:MAG: serine protease [Sphingobium sp.]|nr:serine protease [Sphingobium sp.]
MVAFLRFCTLVLTLAGSLLLASAPARADQADIAAAARSVVRVALVASNDGEAYFVGHGSGVMVAPDKVLTAAHVVELARSERNIVIGVIPAEGTQSFGGRIVAYSPGNDLALIQLEKGRLPVATFFAGAMDDGAHVTAIGYPGSVDRAQGLSLQQMITPMSPVKTSGNVSQGRAGGSIDTILHTAPMARGNSGGPLVDDCGRVLGINSFGSDSEGGDAEFGFAVSDREIASFLRQAGVEVRRNATRCVSLADFVEGQNRALADRSAAERASTQANEARTAANLEKARAQAEQDIYASRENHLALAALLLAAAVLALGATGLFYTQDKQKQMFLAGGAATALLLAMLLAFITRPSFSEIEDRIRQAPQSAATGKDIAQPRFEGALQCRLDEAQSRVTLSQTDDVALDWLKDGCVNGRTQYIADGKGFSRLSIPDNEPDISIDSFDPATGAYRTERYYLDGATMQKARELRAATPAKACSADPEAVAAQEALHAQVRAMLPRYPNERLSYQCMRAPKGEAAAP